MKTDNSELTAIIDKCFDYSMDGRLKPAQQTQFLVLGKRFRGCLVNLLSATFNDGTAEVVAANKAISARSQELSDSVQLLTQASDVLDNLNHLVTTLDGLLNLAAGFK